MLRTAGAQIDTSTRERMGQGGCGDCYHDIATIVCDLRVRSGSVSLAGHTKGRAAVRHRKDAVVPINDQSLTHSALLSARARQPDLASPAFKANPFPYFARLREVSPIREVRL